MIPVSNAKTLDGIRVRKQNRNLNSIDVPRKTVSVDTETENGNIFLIADSQGNYLEHPNITFENIALFLLRNEGSWIFCYNLGYDAECILKLLPEKTLKSYKWKKELEFSYKGYKIIYIDRKKLTISKGHHSISCYDIAQYYDNKPLLQSYSENIRKPLGTQYLKIKSRRQIFSLHYYSRHKKEIRKYCIDDCLLTKELSEKWVETFHDTFGFYPDNWISSGYLAEKVLINNDIYIPLFNETDYEIQELARHCFVGGRFELIRRGYVGYCCLYDINSAYPYALTMLPDITNGKWIRTKKIHPKAKIGFFLILADVDPKVKIAPFPFVKKNRTICYPSGIFKTYVTLDELRAVKGDSKIKYKILESYQFIPNQNCNYPFERFIEEQYQRRMKLRKEKNGLERAIKIILNSIYGKTAQRTNKVIGNLFNPVISAYITGFTRAYLYRFMKEHGIENEIVAFATDSVAVRKKLGIPNSEKLGEMKLDKEADDVIFLSNGFYRFNGIWKNRGIGYDNEKKQEIEHLDCRIDEKGEFYIKVKTKKMTHIKTGILFNRLKDVGKIEQYEKKINLNSDKKRFWIPSELKSLKDGTFCDSVAIPIDLVGKLISKEEVEFYDDEKYEPESDL
jgi:hypothetical protein